MHEMSLCEGIRRIVEDQARYYPTQSCVVTGDPLTEDGEDIALTMVYGNRLVRLCCKMCRRDFKADPVTYMEKLDALTAEAQRKDYPMTTCPVSGEALDGSEGEPVEAVVAGRLVRLCCKGCRSKLMANPSAYLGMVDQAWQAKGMYLPEGHEAGHDDHEGHDHGG